MDQLEKIIALLTSINSKLTVAPQATPVAPIQATPVAPIQAVAAAAPLVQVAAPTLRSLLVAGMLALASGDGAGVNAALAGIKAIALPNDAVPQDARGLLGKALIVYGDGDAVKAHALFDPHVPVGEPLLLQSVPATGYPALAKTLAAGLNPATTTPMAGLL